MSAAVSTESRLRLRVKNPRVAPDLSRRTELAARIARSAHRHGGQGGHGVASERERAREREREREADETDEHGRTCRCIDCDPDTYRDMEAEMLAGQRDW